MTSRVFISPYSLDTITPFGCPFGNMFAINSNIVNRRATEECEVKNVQWWHFKRMSKKGAALRRVVCCI